MVTAGAIEVGLAASVTLITDVCTLVTTVPSLVSTEVVIVDLVLVVVTEGVVKIDVVETTIYVDVIPQLYSDRIPAAP